MILLDALLLRGGGSGRLALDIFRSLLPVRLPSLPPPSGEQQLPLLRDLRTLPPLLYL